MTAPITYQVLKAQNAETSNALIDALQESEAFQALARYEGKLTLDRDTEDAEKLQKGIDYAKEKGVIDPDYVPEPYKEIDVLGKTPDQVADEILRSVTANESSDTDTGSVIVICGLSGTGKGTTVAKLREKLEKDKKVVTWSNGNIFRSVTFLAATWCLRQEGSDGTFDKEKALTKENLASFMDMLTFEKNQDDGTYDTHIQGLGLDYMVSDIQNTVLKAPLVSKNIPTVAQVTQGEVILFAAEAIKTMGKDGVYVLLEGREQTVNYVRSPDRFILTLSDSTLIGKRRAAQRLMAAVLVKVAVSTDESSEPTEDQIKTALDAALDEMVKEIPSA